MLRILIIMVVRLAWEFSLLNFIELLEPETPMQLSRTSQSVSLNVALIVPLSENLYCIYKIKYIYHWAVVTREAKTEYNCQLFSSRR